MNRLSKRQCLQLAALAWPLRGLAQSGVVHKVYGVELPPLIIGTPYGATGIITDITRQAFARAGAQVEVEVVPWARGFAATKAGEATALIPTIRSPEREELFDFPHEPVYRSDMSLFAAVGRGLSWTGKLSEVSSKRFVKLKGALFSAEFDQAVRDGVIRCEEAHSFAAALRMVDAGRVDLAAVPKLAGLQIAMAEGLATRVQPLEPALTVQNFYLAFARKPGLAELRQRVDEQLQQMQRDGSARAIQDEYRKRNWLPPAKP